MADIYTISGATGNIGRRIAEKLLERGQRVRVIGRSAERLRALVQKGAEALVGDLADGAFLTRSYQGAKAVFAMIPPNMQERDLRGFQNRIADSHVAALRETKVPYVVALSSIGAQLEEGTGVVLGLHDFEQKLKTLAGTNLLVLRPAYFMENLLMQADLIRTLGFATAPLLPNIWLAMVATRDIAERAAERLLALDFIGAEVLYLLGERDLSYAEATRVLGKAIGKQNLQYIQSPFAQAKQAMVQMGLSENAADLIIGLADGLNRGIVQQGILRTRENTTPTSIEEFAKDFTQAFQKAA